MTNKNLEFWTGEFGHEYIKRNLAEQTNLRSRFFLWSEILRTIQPALPKSILEVGCNVGINLRVLKMLTDAELYAVEPFLEALEVCVKDKVIEDHNAFNTSAYDMSMLDDRKVEMVFTSGVLIHIPPNDLKKATDNIVRIANKYIVCVEYFSDKEEEIQYRGYQDVLFKRDFGSFYLDNYPELSLRNYGFAWKKATGLDNLTWWLFEKK